MDSEKEYLTIVYSVTLAEGRKILDGQDWSAASWSHALNDRDALKSKTAECLICGVKTLDE